MKKFLVIVNYPEPFIGEAGRVNVSAHTHAHASQQARELLAEHGWPRGSTYTPRLVDETSYSPSFVDSDHGALAECLA